MPGKVSIVIPVCNQVGYTRICMDYLRKNTDGCNTPFELVIIDNGSTDATGSFFKDLARDTDVRYIRNDRNLGPIIALNQGIKAARGDVVLTMHNDLVVFEEGWLKKIRDLLLSDASIGLVGLAGRKRIDKRGVVDEASLVHHLCNENLNAPMTLPYDEVAVLDGVSIAARKAVFEKIRCFDEVYGYMHFYDLDISLKSRKHGFKNVVINVEALHIFNGGVTRKTAAYKNLVPNDTKLLDHNAAIFFKKWRGDLPINILSKNS
ncbi:MAG: glycosyltransferase [Candidatus Omnitrophica bacterium]|nr:glycosyltransferase [Candidatus Omnitrophota bacterium]